MYEKIQEQENRRLSISKNQAFPTVYKLELEDEVSEWGSWEFGAVEGKDDFTRGISVSGNGKLKFSFPAGTSVVAGVATALYQTKNESRQDPLNFPIKLTNKLGHIANLVTMNDFPPTSQDKKLMMELSEKINKEIEVFNKLMTNDVSEFNLSFKKLQLDYLIN